MIWRLVNQPAWFKAFIPEYFPPKDLTFSDNILNKANKATLLLWKLDGITQLLPDLDFFILMYIRMDASSSSQIEWTRATMADVIESESKTSAKIPEDVDDIFHYIDALNYWVDRLKEFPMSLRFIKEVHKVLMSSARSSHFANPGNFRESQNRIWWTSPANAEFVPPPVFEMNISLSNLEKFFHEKDHIAPIIKAWLIHSQFETIHPFLDWNWRTWRILITLFLWLENILERPVLFLSSYFHKHKQVYYDRLNNYHNNDIERWLDFFLDWVIDTATKAIETVKKINTIRDEDMKKIQSLWKSTSEISMKILFELYKLPIVNVSKIQEWTWFTRQWAQKVIDRFVDLWILEQKNKDEVYGRSYIYKKYYDVFTYED